MNNHYIHKEYPKTCDPKDFFGQVKRTVRGKPVSQEQIQMIIGAIKNCLKFNDDNSDILLDIGCGNGALSQYFFENCKEFLGVDFSQYLIEVAIENFQSKPYHVFQEGDAVDYVRAEKYPLRFTKALCYGCFSYFSYQDAEEFLTKLRLRFKSIKALFIGNLPDKDLANKFYEQEFSPDVLGDNLSSIGIWRTKDEMKDLAHKTGWQIEFHQMPEGFYSAHYRYDVILKPMK